MTTRFIARVVLSLAVAGGLAAAADPPKPPKPPKPPTTDQMLDRSKRQRDQKQLDDALQTVEQVIALPGATTAQKQEAFELLVDIFKRRREMDKALAAAARMGTELAGASASRARSSVLQGNLCEELNRRADAIAHFADAVERSDDPRLRQVCLYRIATLQVAEGHVQQALETYDRLFTDNPGVIDYWYDAQRNSVELLRKLKGPREALGAARIVLDASVDNYISDAVGAIARLLKEIDGNVTRANAVILFQQYGPAGQDGRAGTADDLTNPLASVPYPKFPRREEAFARFRPLAGDTAEASRYRALTYIYSGRPAEALPHFAEALRRKHGSPSDIHRAIHELVVIGVRDAQGHSVDLRRFFEFIRCGPAGRDGEPGTPDDLKDPFAEIGLPPRVPGDDGGLSPPSEENRKALIELRDILEKLVVTERDDAELRRECLESLERVHDALCDWGTSGQADWYMRLLLDSLSAKPAVHVQAELASGGQSATRGGDLHFGNALVFWQEFDAAAGKANPPGDPARQVRKQLDQLLKLLDKPPSVTPKLAPLK